MPTQSELELAAIEFSTAAQRVVGLATALGAIDVSAVLRGGSLGWQIRSVLDAASARLLSASSAIFAASVECERRASLAAEYDLQLEAYRAEYAIFADELSQWESRWYVYAYEGGPDPGPYPQEPLLPPQPASWADVTGSS